MSSASVGFGGAGGVVSTGGGVALAVAIGGGSGGAAGGGAGAAQAVSPSVVIQIGASPFVPVRIASPPRVRPCSRGRRALPGLSSTGKRQSFRQEQERGCRPRRSALQVMVLCVLAPSERLACVSASSRWAR